MANTNSQKFTQPRPMRVDGNAVVINDKVTVATNPVANDTHTFLLPGGSEMAHLKFKVPDMDAAAGLAGKIGFKAADGGTTVKMSGVEVANDDDYFRAAGALGQAAAVIDCDFLPVRFDEDVLIQITWTVTAAGAFTAGDIHMSAIVNQHGPN